MNLDQVTNFACDDLRGLINDRKEDILKVARAASLEAGEEEKPMLKMSLGITVDLDKNEMESVLTIEGGKIVKEWSE